MNEKFNFSAQQIRTMLPHKYPFLLLDQAYDIVPGKKGYGSKFLTINEWYFQGHFPGEPIVPGVLIIESLAQLTAVIYLSRIFEGSSMLDIDGTQLEQLAGKVGYLVKTDMKFMLPVRPGCELNLSAEIIKTFGGLSNVRVAAKVDKRLVAEGVLSVSEK